MESTKPVSITDAVEPRPHNTRVGWMAVGILLLLTVLSVLDRSLLTLLVDPVMTDLELTETQMGMLMGFAFGLFFFLGALPIGWALDKFSRPLVIWFGVTVWSLGTAACGLAQSFWSFFAARAMVGSGEAVMGPGAQSLLPELFPPEKLGFAFSVYSLSSSIGAGLAFAIGGLAATLIDPKIVYDVLGVASLRGWQLIFLMVGLPGLLLAFLIFLVPDKRQVLKSDSTNYIDYFRVAREHWRFILPHHLGLLCVATIGVAMATWGPAFYQRVHGMSVGQVGPALGLAITVGPIVALPIHARIVDRLFAGGRLDIHLRYMAITMLLAVPVVAATFLVSSAMLSLVLFCLSKALMCTYLSLPFVILQIVLPSNLRAKAASIILVLNGILTLGCAPVLVAVITEALGGAAMVGYSLLICGVVGLPLCAIFLWCALKPVNEILTARKLAGDLAGVSVSSAVAGH